MIKLLKTKIKERPLNREQVGSKLTVVPVTTDLLKGNTTRTPKKKKQSFVVGAHSDRNQQGLPGRGCNVIGNGRLKKK